jgi:hypothetical protein
MKKAFVLSLNILFIFNIVFCKKTLAQNPFPEVSGWNGSGEIKTYNPGNLWECIDGAADYYLNYGFSKLEVKEYSKVNDVYIKVEIYDHQLPMNAFGIYAYERTPEAEFLEIGKEGYIVHSALNFYIGNFYVKIYSHHSDTSTINAIRLIAVKISENIKQKDTGTELLSFLPSDEKIKHSEKYFPTNFLGYSFFKNALSAEYTFSDKKHTVFIIHAENNQLTLEMLQKYLDFLKVAEKAEENKLYAMDDFFNGKVLVQQYNNYLIGTVELRRVEKFHEIFYQITNELSLQ